MSSADKINYFLFVMYDSVDGEYLKVRSMDLQDGSIHYDPLLCDFMNFNNQEITNDDCIDRDTICQTHNSKELQRAKDLLKTVKEILKEYPASQDYKNQKDYFENIIGIYLTWFTKNGIDPINLSRSSNLDADQPRKTTRPKDPNREAMIQKLRIRYFELHDKEGFKKKKCLDILEKDFPNWKRSTIESYLK